MIDSQRNARFWVYSGDALVKLTLKPGQSLHHCQGGPTDEGWSSSASEWTRNGQFIDAEHVSDGRDCDGRLTQSTTLSCLVADLYARAPDEWAPVYMPAWTQDCSSQRDEYAEISNY